MPDIDDEDLPQPFPFATVDDLKARWRDMPDDSESVAYAKVLLEDASQFILDVAPGAAKVSASTRRRVVCAVVRRVMESDAQPSGVESVQETTGPFSTSFKVADGAFFLRKDEKRSLSGGHQAAFVVDTAGGEPIWEA